MEVNDKKDEVTEPALHGVGGEDGHVPPVPIVVEILSRRQPGWQALWDTYYAG